jgi:hypothetical protein
MNQCRCEHREMICHKDAPCGFQEFGDEESEVMFCSFRSIENEDKNLPSGAIFDNTKKMVDEIRQSERDTVLEELCKSCQFGDDKQEDCETCVVETMRKELRQQAGEP